MLLTNKAATFLGVLTKRFSIKIEWPDYAKVEASATLSEVPGLGSSILDLILLERKKYNYLFFGFVLSRVLTLR